MRKRNWTLALCQLLYTALVLGVVLYIRQCEHTLHSVSRPGALLEVALPCVLLFASVWLMMLAAFEKKILFPIARTLTVLSLLLSLLSLPVTALQALDEALALEKINALSSPFDALARSVYDRIVAVNPAFLAVYSRLSEPLLLLGACIVCLLLSGRIRNATMLPQPPAQPFFDALAQGTLGVRYDMLPLPLRQKKSPVTELILGLVSLNIYSCFSVSRRMKKIADDRELYADDMLCLLLVPLFSFFWVLHYERKLHTILRLAGLPPQTNTSLCLLTAVLLPPLCYALLHRELNRLTAFLADAHSEAVTAASQKTATTPLVQTDSETGDIAYRNLPI